MVIHQNFFTTDSIYTYKTPLKVVWILLGVRDLVDRDFDYKPSSDVTAHTLKVRVKSEVPRPARRA
jgi:hypothetical protein